MDSVKLLLGADLRRRWRSWLALVVLFGVLGGLAIGSFSGWRRTSTAMDRFLEHHRPYNAFAEGRFTPEELHRIPGVEAVLGGDYFLLVPLDAAGRPQPERVGMVSPFSFDDASAFGSFARPIVVSGRLADPAVAEEVMVDEELAGLYDLAPGSTFPMQAYGPDQAEQLFESIGSLEPTGREFRFEVTGVVRMPEDVVPRPEVPDVVYLGSSAIFLGPAFHAAHWRQDVASLGALFDAPEGGGGYELRVDFTATSREHLARSVKELDPDALVDFTAGDAEKARQEAERAIGLQATALLAFGVVVTSGGAVLGSQAVRRHLADDAPDRRAWRALGFDRRGVAVVLAAKGAAVGGAAAVLAVATAVALSPLTPVGYARRAEVDPGVHVDLLASAAGALLLLVLVAAKLTAPAWRERLTGSSLPAVGPRVGLGDRAARLGLPAPVVTGVRNAALGTGGRTVAATVVVAAIAVVAGFGFASSEARLAGDPKLWGWNWDVVVGDGNDAGLIDRALRVLPEDPDVEGLSLVHDLETVTLRAGDRVLDSDGAALEPVTGDVRPAMLAGTPPTGDDEIALGGATARDLGVSVGDRLEVDLGAGPRPVTVSGLAVMNLGLDAERIGEGALLTPALIERAGAELAPRFFLLKHADGVDPAAAYEDLRAQWGNTVLRPVRSLDVDQLHHVRHLPVWFSLLLAVVAAATLGFVLHRTVRHGRHDLAVLRALGFDGGQIRRSVAAQATVLVLPAAVAGAFVGLVLGRVSWTAVTEGMGAPTVQVMPYAALAGVIAGAVLLANAIAAQPARTAAAARAADVLRAE